MIYLYIVLLASVIAYIIATLCIGIFTTRYVKTAKDFALAGRKMPVFITASALFATWFGAETVLGASSEFLEHGLIGVVEDPFGAALCLFLVGAFFAKPLYQMNLLTLGDFYRQRYGAMVEVISSIFMAVSYLGWAAAQLVAFAIILETICGLPIQVGIWIAASVVFIYTLAGGMWAVSITDFVQTLMIIIGLVVLAIEMLTQVGGLSNLIQSCPPEFFRFVPENNPEAIMNYASAWMVIGLGSIPQQDIFQRMMSANSSKTAVRGAFIGASMYLTIALLPLFIALAAKVLYPELVYDMDKQGILVNMVLQHTSVPIQILFFGALLSAIMSTASGAILAPSTIIAENIIKPHFKKIPEDKFLFVLRLSVTLVTMASIFLAYGNKTIYELVAESSVLSLVSLFVPLVAGLWWRPANSMGALASILVGTISWLFAYMNPICLGGAQVPALIVGLFFSLVALFIGTWFTRHRD